MQTAARTDFIRVEDYLEGEKTSQVRHEYLGGLVYAMAGETRNHNTITLNLAVALRQHLKGRPCQLYMSDIRVNFDLRGDEYFYYPDLVVACNPRDTHKRFVKHPKLIIEVLSESTERVAIESGHHLQLFIADALGSIVGSQSIMLSRLDIPGLIAPAPILSGIAVPGDCQTIGCRAIVKIVDITARLKFCTGRPDFPTFGKHGCRGC